MALVPSAPSVARGSGGVTSDAGCKPTKARLVGNSKNVHNFSRLHDNQTLLDEQAQIQEIVQALTGAR